MSNLPFHSSSPDRWSKPRGYSDSGMRRLVHGPIQPMERPSFLERLFGAR